jgi:hypothetical protein
MSIMFPTIVALGICGLGDKIEMGLRLHRLGDHGWSLSAKRDRGIADFQGMSAGFIPKTAVDG